MYLCVAGYILQILILQSLVTTDQVLILSTMNREGVANFYVDLSIQPEKLVSLSAMKDYSNKSHEELRYEDYQLGNKGTPSSIPQPESSYGFRGCNCKCISNQPAVVQINSAAPIGARVTPNTFVNCNTQPGAAFCYPAFVTFVQPPAAAVCARHFGFGNFGPTIAPYTSPSGTPISPVTAPFGSFGFNGPNETHSNVTGLFGGPRTSFVGLNGPNEARSPVLQPTAHPQSPFGSSSSSGTSNQACTPYFGAPQPGIQPTLFKESPFSNAIGSNGRVFGQAPETPNLVCGAPLSIPAICSSTTPGFGASTTPGFGASTMPFGASTTSGFGASTMPFGVSTTPGVGASTMPFGASTTPGVGASKISFGASTTPGFGASTMPSGASTTPFGAPNPFPPFGAPTYVSSPVIGPPGGPSTSPFSSARNVVHPTEPVVVAKPVIGDPDNYCGVPKGLGHMVEKLGFNPWCQGKDTAKMNQYDSEIKGGILSCEEADKDEDIIALTEFAVEQHNALHKDEKVEFVNVAAACLEAVGGGRYHIALDAKEVSGFAFTRRFYAAVLRKETERPNQLTVLEKWLPSKRLLLC